MASIANVHSLSETKRRLLDRYLRQGPAQQPGCASAITPRPLAEPTPLSLSQEQIFLREELVPEIPPLYNESVTVYRFGSMDVDLLERSFTEVIRRHEIWRTTYHTVNGATLQTVNPAPKHIRLPFIDLRAVPEKERLAETIRLLSEDARRKFDMQQGPLIYASLVRFSEQESRLYLIVHQSILDGVSVYQVLLDELSTLYSAYSRGETPTLPEPAIQFGDYAAWQRRTLQGEVLEKQLDYWREQLAGELPVLAWPASRRPSRQSFRGSIEPFTLPKTLSSAMKILAQRAGSTLFVGLLSSFVLLLHLYTKQDDLIVGTVSPAGRKRSEAQRLIGYFLNPVPLRFRLRGLNSFLDLVAHVQAVLGGAITHDDIPFEHLVKQLQPKPDPSRNPFFTVAASLEPPLAGVGPQWNLTPMDLESGGARWDLYFVWDDRPKEMIGRVQYNPDLFAREEIHSMLRDFRQVLEKVLDDPGQRIFDVMLSGSISAAKSI